MKSKAKPSDYNCDYCGQTLLIINADGANDYDGDTVLCASCGFVGSLDINDEGDVTIVEVGDA